MSRLQMSRLQMYRDATSSCRRERARTGLRGRRVTCGAAQRWSRHPDGRGIHSPTDPARPLIEFREREPRREWHHGDLKGRVLFVGQRLGMGDDRLCVSETEVACRQTRHGEWQSLDEHSRFLDELLCGAFGNPQRQRDLGDGGTSGCSCLRPLPHSVRRGHLGIELRESTMASMTELNHQQSTFA
jgi:hypothetical protein